MKKLLTILLTVLMALTIGAINVFAEDEPVATITFAIDNQNNKNADKKVKDFLEAKNVVVTPEGKADKKDVKVEWFATKDGAKTGGALGPETKLSNESKYIVIVTVKFKGNLAKKDDVTVKYNNAVLTSGIVLAEDKKTLTIEVPVTIVPAPIEVERPTKENGKAPVYDKEVHSQVKYDAALLDTAYELANGSVVSATDAGEYSATFALKDGYVWKGDAATNKENVTITWNIAQAEVKAPKATAKLVYTGSKQTGVNVPEDVLYTLSSGDVEAIDAGDYSATFALNDAKNYKWEGDFTGTVEWTIEKVATELKFNPSKADHKKGEAIANKDHAAEIQVVNYSEDMVLEYCAHGENTYAPLTVTKIGNAYYIYLTDIADHWHVRIADTSKNYKQKGEKSDVEVKESNIEYEIDKVSTYKKNGNALISCDRDYKEDEWNFLTIDGKLVDLSNYDVVKGSTDVTLKEAYINTLSVGDHTVGFHYKNGVLVEGTLSVLNKPAPTPKKSTYVAPKTGIEG